MARKKDVHEDYAKVFPRRLRELMEEKGTTQQQLADHIHKQRQTVSLYCDGSSSPDWETLASIAKYFSVSVDYLVDNDGQPVPNHIDTKQVEISPRFVYGMVSNRKQNSEIEWAVLQRVLGVSGLKIVTALANYAVAKNAYDEYKRVFMMYDKEQSDHFCFGPDAKYNIIHKKTAEEITKKMDSEEYSLELMQNLSRQIRYSADEEESLNTPSIADMARLRLMDVIDGILKFLGEDEKVKSLLGLSEPPKYEITYDEEMTRNAQEHKKQQQSNTMF